MPDVTTRQRNRLEELWSKLFNQEMEASLLDDKVVTSQFLSQNNIRLETHAFDITDNADSNLRYNPPILFEYCPESVLNDHPIDEDGFDGPEDRDLSLRYRTYNPPPSMTENDRYHSVWNPYSCTTAVSAYLENWAFGGFPRQLPDSVLDLAELRHISRVIMPNPFMVGQGFNQIFSGPKKGWRTLAYEFEKEGNSHVYPHVILLGAQSCDGHDGSIMHGELAQIVTATRIRATQPHMTDEELDALEELDERETVFSFEQLDLENPDPIFTDEQIFPVLMVSLVGPQHGRIYYACMDGLDLVIRQSKLYSFEVMDSGLLDHFAKILLSRPLQETEK